MGIVTRDTRKVTNRI